MRKNLKLLRVQHLLTQQEMAKRLNISRQTYADVENGKRTGTKKFWNDVQAEFEIPSSEMWDMMADERV